MRNRSLTPITRYSRLTEKRTLVRLSNRYFESGSRSRASREEHNDANQHRSPHAASRFRRHRGGTGRRRRHAGDRANKADQARLCEPADRSAAAFAEADNFIIASFKDATKGGIKVGGASAPVEVVVKDSQSNPNRAAQVAKDLIVQDKVDLMLVASTPETTNPVSTQCEIEEVPCISTVAPWQPWFIGRQANPGGGPPAWKDFNYTYHFFWGLEDVIAVFTNMWSQLPTNKSVGGLFPNDGDGNAWGDKQVGFPPVLEKLGYKLTDPGRYQNLTDNFSAQINAFKGANCEIVTGVVLPPDFTTFWKQALQQGYKPKIASIGKAILFPVAVEALGRDGNNLSSEVWWSPNHRSNLRSPARARRISRPPTRPRPRNNGRSRSASCMHCSRLRSTCSSARRNAAMPRRP
jgi:ABC-type branched-chain amino acid transport systems, periplasmic component